MIYKKTWFKMILMIKDISKIKFMLKLNIQKKGIMFRNTYMMRRLILMVNIKIIRKKSTQKP